MSWTYFLLLGIGFPGFLIGRFLSGDAWMGLDPAILIVFTVSGLAIGAVIGEQKGRMWPALWLGLILGPLGWFIARILPHANNELTHREKAS